MNVYVCNISILANGRMAPTAAIDFTFVQTFILYSYCSNCIFHRFVVCVWWCTCGEACMFFFSFKLCNFLCIQYYMVLHWYSNSPNDVYVLQVFIQPQIFIVVENYDFNRIFRFYYFSYLFCTFLVLLKKWINWN